MGATLTSLTNGENPRLVFVVAIEGYQYLLTTGSASAAVTAWSGTDWSAALEGLEIDWHMKQGLDPWNAFPPGSSVELRVMDCDGTDRFGIDTHRREGGTSTKLAANVDVNDTTITVARADDFAASGTVYLGCEAMAYSSRDTVADTFTISTRGRWSPFTTESGGRFARSHQLTQVADGVPPIATAATTVRTLPTEWAGKWVGIWIHAVRSGGVLDTKAEAHLAFAGRITPDPFKDTPEGITIVSCDDVRATLRDTVILRRQFRARVKEGVLLVAGDRFKAKNSRFPTVGSTAIADAEDLIVVSGASGNYEIEEGLTSPAEFEAAVNAWLADALGASDLLFTMSYRFATASDAGLRGSLRFDDADTSGAGRQGFVTTENESLRKALGWSSDGLKFSSNSTSDTVYGEGAPFRVNAGWVPYDTTATLEIDVASGEFVDQTSFLPPAAQSAAFSDGILRIGDQFFACGTPSLSNGEGTVTIRRIRELDTAIGSQGARLALTVEDSGDLNMYQVLILDGTVKTITMTLLTSTGVASFNGDYDSLPAQCGAGIPWSLLTEAFENELDAISDVAAAMPIVVETPTRLTDLLNISFVSRNATPIWYQGRLKLTGFATPTSAATETFDEDDKAAPVAATNDNQRAVAAYSDEWFKTVVRIRHNRSIADDSYRDTLNLIGVDAGTGERRITLDARNAVRGGGFIVGEDIDALAPRIISALPFLTRPVLTVTVPIDYTKFETLVPGTVLLFSDEHMRDPTDGERGVSSKPALVVRHSYSWGGSMIGVGAGADPKEPHGEMTLMLFPQMSLAAYCPTAEVDSTVTGGGFDAGYNSSVPSLRCQAHAHSESSESVDAARFSANDEITICEIDPSDPASPTTWNRTVVSVSSSDITISAGLGTPSWDNTKKYRIYSRAYSAAVTAQRANVYQADGPPPSGDGFVADSREPYGYGHGVQTTTGTATSLTTLARRHTAATYGDGAPLTTGAAYDSAINLNHLVNYGTAPQMPTMYSEPATFTGSGTRRLVRTRWQFVGVGRLRAGVTRKLWVSPRFKSDDGTSCSVRVSLLRNRPRSADPSAPSLMDITRPTPYAEVTFTTTSTSYVIPAAQALDISHLRLDPTILGGGGFLICEITNHAVLDGLAECWVGPQVAA